MSFRELAGARAAETSMARRCHWLPADFGYLPKSRHWQLYPPPGRSRHTESQMNMSRIDVFKVSFWGEDQLRPRWAGAVGRCIWVQKCLARPVMEVRPLHTRVWHNGLEIVVDVLWGLLILLLTILAFQEVFEEKGSCWQRCCGNFWIVVDWTFILVGIALIGFFFVPEMQKTLENLRF